MAQAKLPRAPARTAADYRAEILLAFTEHGPREAAAVAARALEQFPNDRRLQALARTLAPVKARVPPQDPNAPRRDRDRERRLFAELAPRHPDRWFAIHEGEVLAMGDDSKAVYDAARAKRPDVAPWLVHSPRK